VSFGRALIINPTLLLLDEPFGNLDSETRTNMQALFKRVARHHRITTLFVTHDLKEAILVGDRIAHIRSGRLRVFDTLEQLGADPEMGLARELDFWSDLGTRLKPEDS
jgi:putrescine transport system ATP-binding protein